MVDDAMASLTLDSELDHDHSASASTLLNKSQNMWRVARNSEQFLYPREGSTRLTWEDLASRFFVSVYDSYWSSFAYTNKHSGQGQVLRLTEPFKELKLPLGVKWKGSTTLKSATAQANGVGFFEYLQLIETFCKEQNIPPTNYERRTTALLLGIEDPALRTMVLPHVQDSVSVTTRVKIWTSGVSCGNVCYSNPPHSTGGMRWLRNAWVVSRRVTNRCAVILLAPVTGLLFSP